ncbi:MAG: Gfo/Idh/MocA family oxidoreductase [Armatimonadia bacterium]
MKVAIVGCGGIGRAHALAYNQIDGVEVAFVVDRDPGRAEALATEVGAEPLTDLRLLPDSVRVVSVATDPASHGRLATECLRRGFAVFCEKPLGMTAAEARGLVEQAREVGQPLSVGFKMRYEPVFAKARELVGKVGSIVQIATTKVQPFAHRGAGEWRDKVGAMFELSVHDFDLISFITGLRPMKVQAATLSHRLGWEREDGFTALVEYEGGAQGALSGCYTLEGKWLASDFCLTVTGEKGYMRVLRGDRIVMHTDTYEAVEVEAPGNTFVTELGEFVEAVQDGKEPPIEPEAGYWSTALIDGIREAGLGGKAVEISRI